MRELLAIRDWLKALGSLCAGNMSTRDAQAKLAAYAPMLAREFKAAAFTPDSLTAVARECKFFPSFGELCTALSAWWEVNRPYEPTVPLLTGPRPDIPKPRDPPTEAELAAIDPIMQAFRMQHPVYLKSRDLPPEVKPRLLSAGPLLATYEQLAKHSDPTVARPAAQRAAMLRQQLATKPEEEPDPCRP